MFRKSLRDFQRCICGRGHRRGDGLGFPDHIGCWPSSSRNQKHPTFVVFVDLPCLAHYYCSLSLPLSLMSWALTMFLRWPKQQHRHLVTGKDRHKRVVVDASLSWSWSWSWWYCNNCLVRYVIDTDTVCSKSSYCIFVQYSCGETCLPTSRTVQYLYMV